jgi:hypothetical protein
VREHPDVHVFDEQRRAHKLDRRAVRGVQVQFLHAVDLEKRRSQTVCPRDVLWRVDVLDARSVWNAVEVERQRDLRQGHASSWHNARARHGQDGEARRAGDGQEVEEEQGGSGVHGMFSWNGNIFFIGFFYFSLSVWNVYKR